MTVRNASLCPQCGRRRTADPASHGLCPACLLATAAAMEDRGCPYEVLAPIEQDTQGVTYLAQRKKTPDPFFVALKIVEVGDGSAILSRFRALKPALARLQHPGAGKVVDAGSTSDGSVYIASQYVAGSPLSGMLSRHTLQRGDRAEIARQITEAVGAAQAAGVAHLRLDASMVKVSVAGGLRASVIGFGLSAILDGRLGGPDVDASALDDLLRRLDL